MTTITEITEERKNILLIIEAIQLPIVLIIILSSYYFVSLTKGLESKDWYGTKNPLLFISGAFTLNLIYLLLQIIYSLNGDETLETASMFLDIITTTLLFLASINIFFAMNHKNYSSTAKYEQHKSAIYNIFFVFSVITLGVTLIQYLNLLTDELWKWTLRAFINVYHLSARILAGYFICSQMAMIRSHSVKIAPRHFLSAGFFLWALIQTLPMNTTDFWGFSLSTIAKSLILSGFYGFYVKYAKDIAVKQKHYNQRLRLLQGKIQDISNSKTIEELEQKVCEHLTGSHGKKLFDFHYTTFFEVNYPENLIKLKLSYPPRRTAITSYDVSFESNDILAWAYRENKPFPIRGNIVDGFPVSIDEPGSMLNKQVYIDCNHQDYSRIIIPIKGINDTARVVTMIEVGYNVKNAANVPGQNIKIEEILNLYLDNLSQVYESLLAVQLKDNIARFNEYCYKYSRDDHNEYLKLVLEKTMKLLNIDFTLFILNYTNKNHSEKDRIKVIGPENILDVKRRAIESIINRHIDSDEGRNLGGLEKEFKNLLKYKEIRILNFPLTEDVKIQIILFSDIANLDTENTKMLFELSNRKLITKTYLEKKLHYYTTLLINPNDAITDFDVNMMPNIEVLKGYFETSYVSIWVKDKRGIFIQRNISEGIKNMEHSKHAEVTITGELQDCIKIYADDIVKTELHAVFADILKTLKAKSMILKQIKSQHQEIGFITIFFRSGNAAHTTVDASGTVSPEDCGFLNFTSNKIQTTIQTHNLIEAYKAISDSFKGNNQEETLQIITDKALDVLNADPIVLFKCNDGQSVFFKDVTFSKKSDFLNKKKSRQLEGKRDERVELAEIIVQNQTEYFNNYTDYNHFLKEHVEEFNHLNTEEDFWTSEKIKSMAAIRLTNEITPHRAIGVLFINFRNEVVFTKEAQRLIETFAAFASASMANIQIMDRNTKYLLDNMRLSLPLIEEFVAAGLLHNARKNNDSIHTSIDNIINEWEAMPNSKSKKEFININAKLVRIKRISEELNDQFEDIRSVYNKKENLFRENVNLVKLIESTLDNLSSELRIKNIDYTERIYPAEPALVVCDEGQVKMSVNNILKNAYEALNVRGKLKINVKQNDKTATIEITDYGKKISPEMEKEMFEIYKTDKVHGSGLGLPISKLFIEKNHNGKIDFKQNKTSKTFSITLPKKQKDYEYTDTDS